MNRPEKSLVSEIAILFKDYKNIILKNWIKISTDKIHLMDESELDSFKNGFEKLLNDFITYLPSDNLKEYYNSNRLLAKNLAYNDISFGKFIKLFHFFEKAYIPILASSFRNNDLEKYLIAIDDLHHETISIICEEYFNVKDNTVLALVKLAELRDNTTGHHLERTRDYSILLAREYGESNDFISQIGRASSLHDIGKVGIRDNILLKPGKLTTEEFEEMKKHCIIGAEAIDKILCNQKVNRGYLFMARDIALYHHEKLDGSGYPYGLKGRQIPLSARIFAIADAYDAIVSKRPYKEPLSHSEAIEKILKDSGKHFDSEIVKVFLQNESKFEDINEKYSLEFK